MKKQILLLTFLSLAFIFAGISNANAQTVGAAKPYETALQALPADCIIPTAFTSGACSADGLHPVQGETYDYTVSTNSGDFVRWFVVNNNDLAPATPANDSLVSTSSGILPIADGNIDPSTGLGPYIYGDGATPITNYNALTADFSTIQISWKYFDGIGDQVILVAYVEAADGCSNNLAVFRIIPQPAFTIDIASIQQDGTNPQLPAALGGTPNEDCVSPVESAVYSGSDITPDAELTVDYGENYMYFIVNGANYIDSWMPEFQISYDQTAPAAVEASWAYMNDATSTTATDWNTLTGTLGNTWTSSVPVIAGASAADPGSIGAGVVPAAGGECIIVRVRFDWGTDVEHDQANGIVTVAADGVAYDGVGSDATDLYDDASNFGDLHWDSCTQDGFTNDVVNYIITPRPAVEPGTPDTEDKTGDTIN